MLCASVALIVHFGFWIVNSPFAVFTATAFSHVGLSNKDLNVDALDQHYTTWSLAGLAVTMINALTTAVLAGVIWAKRTSLTGVHFASCLFALQVPRKGKQSLPKK